MFSNTNLSYFCFLRKEWLDYEILETACRPEFHTNKNSVYFTDTPSRFLDSKQILLLGDNFKICSNRAKQLIPLQNYFTPNFWNKIIILDKISFSQLISQPFQIFYIFYFYILGVVAVFFVFVLNQTWLSRYFLWFINQMTFLN